MEGGETGLLGFEQVDGFLELDGLLLVNVSHLFLLILDFSFDKLRTLHASLMAHWIFRLIFYYVLVPFDLFSDFALHFTNLGQGLQLTESLAESLIECLDRPISYLD